MIELTTHWFADRSDSDPDKWQAFVQIWGGCFPVDGIWFSSEESCNAFTKDIPSGLTQIRENRT